MRPPLRSSGHRPHGGSMRPSHRPTGHRPHSPSMNPRRPNMNCARPNRSFFIQAPSYETRPFLKSSAVKTQYRAPWVPTVNKNNPPVNRKFSTGRRNFPTTNRKFPTACRKFATRSTKNHTADMGRKGKADSPGDGFKPSGEEEKKDTEGSWNEESEALIIEEPRVNQEKDSVNSTNRVNAVSSTVNAASNEFNVVCGKSSIKLLDDLNMPDLEDISIFEDSNKDVFCVEADLNNIETTFQDSPGDGFKPLGEEEKKDTEGSWNKESKALIIEEPRVNQEKDSVNSTNRVNAVSSTVNAASNEFNVVCRKSSIKLLDDLNMPDLEDISIFEDSNKDVFGVEADLNNIETTFQVSPIPTTRIHKDHSVE
nr:hypothetical protein [Tanacetum cinerariifolium]